MTNKLRRLKETLVNNMEKSSQVFIVGHNNPDYDSIGAALGVATLAKSLGVEPYIIVNDLAPVLEPGVKKIIDESRNHFHFITLEEYRELADKQSLLVVVDVNKQKLTSVQNDLDRVGTIMIIDHHQKDEFSLPAQYKFIDENASSASEIVAQMLNAKQIRYSKDIAKYLLAGIMLDTKRFQKNTTPITLDTAEKLCLKGADYDAVNKLFISNYVEDDEIYSLIFGKHVIRENNEGTKEIEVANTHIQAYPQLFGEPTVSFTLNRSKPNIIYRQVSLAKTADKMLSKYSDACFVIGYVSPTDVGISARSKCGIDVGKILSGLEYADFPCRQALKMDCSLQYIKSGGGNRQSAGGRVTTDDIFAIEKFLMDEVFQMATPYEQLAQEETTEKPIVLVRKKKEVKVR